MNKADIIKIIQNFTGVPEKKKFPKFKKGDIVFIKDRKIAGVITNIYDHTQSKTYIPEAWGWYYFLEYKGGGSSIPEKNIKLIISIDEL